MCETNETSSEFELREVNFLYNDNSYPIKLYSSEIEQISTDPQKYEEFGKKLEKQRLLKEKSCVSSTPKTPEKFKWTADSIKLLLSVRFEMQKQFDNPKCKKNKLWMQVASKMAEIGFYTLDWEECYGKYRNLFQTYKNNKEKRLKKTGESSITWEFYDLFDTVLGHKASSCPPKEILSSSISEASETLSETLEMDIDDETENVDTQAESGLASASSNSKKKNSNKKMSVPQYLFIKSERDKEVWNEKKLLKEKEIDAINNLADAIRESSRQS